MLRLVAVGRGGQAAVGRLRELWRKWRDEAGSIAVRHPWRSRRDRDAEAIPSRVGGRPVCVGLSGIGIFEQEWQAMATIQARSREGAGKGVARKLRREGRVPAVIYGGGGGNANISLDRHEWVLLMFREGSQLRTRKQDLVLDGGRQEPVLLRGLQLHPVDGLPLHVDFLRFNVDMMIQVAVPVHVIDEADAPGLKSGGIVQVVRHELEVHCKAGDIPARIDVSIAGLQIGHSIHINDIPLPPGVQVDSEDNFAVLAMVGVKAEPVGEGEEGAVAAAPEAPEATPSE
ncbi:MAG: 50S ribosomal protein L25/general stress protein Ctc [Magnetococcales bacterium]|nr:50S ribosomal protein L25/general stress protein Ctc [Magnetococcales bacterium]